MSISTSVSPSKCFWIMSHHPNVTDVTSYASSLCNSFFWKIILLYKFNTIANQTYPQSTLKCIRGHSLCIDSKPSSVSTFGNTLLISANTSYHQVKTIVFIDTVDHLQNILVTLAIPWKLLFCCQMFNG